MAVSLNKGGKVSLVKEAEKLGIKLDNVAVGLGWDCNNSGGSTFDLDAWALVIEDEGAKKKNLVYFANTLDSSRNIHHLGDNLTGEGDGDDETITISLSNLPDTYKHVLVGVTIYRGNQKRQSFKDIDNTFIRVYDKNTGIEICKYNDKFKNDLGDFATMLFGAFSRVDGQWEFNAVGRGSKISSIPDALNVYSDYTVENNINNNLNGGKKVMAVSLSKGGKVSLAKVAADAGINGGLTKVVVGLGWNPNAYDGGGAFDLDAAAFLTSSNGKVRNETDFVFYGSATKDAQGRKCDAAQSVIHTGDNRTGEGDGDDEQILIDLTKVPEDVQKISFTCTIDQADTRNQNFGMVSDSYVRVMDEATGTELIRYDLGEDFSVETAIVVAEIYRHNGEWKFNAVGAGFAGGLAALCGNFGIDVA